LSVLLKLELGSSELTLACILDISDTDTMAGREALLPCDGLQLRVGY
jgi:hypothetical protein